MAQFMNSAFEVNSPNVVYSENSIESKYIYKSTVVDTNKVSVNEETLHFKTVRKVPKLGVLLVGWGGNNGSTVTAGILANKLGLSWTTKDGRQAADYFGSITQSSTFRLGTNSSGEPVYMPFKNILPMVDPNDVILSGWDISNVNLAEAMKRARVLDYDLQRQLAPHMEGLVPMPSIYFPDFIAANQADRANNVLEGSKQELLERIRSDIRSFRVEKQVDKVIVLWTANTERFCSVEAGLNLTADELLKSIADGAEEISPSQIFAVASILEGCSYINGSPQNTFVPGVIELAQRKQGVYLVGDDFKSGQTKLKSVLMDYLVSAGIKPVSIVSYNHLGNNDGKNLSAPQQFRSKEISKSNVVDDMVESNRILYKEGEHPDHCVVIKYVPYVGDSKRAMDEYTSEIFMGGKNTLVIHNTCEDSLLATPLIIDLFVLCELCERITVGRVSPCSAENGHRVNGECNGLTSVHYEPFHAALSLLSYLLKAPMVPPEMPVVNALAAQRQALVNVFRACVGLPPEDYMLLEQRIPSFIATNIGNKKRRIHQ